MKALIRSYSLEAEMTGTESEGLALQRSLDRLNEDRIVVAIERVLERCLPSSGYLCLERLEIDAGSVDMARLEADLPDLIADSLEKSLQSLMPSLSIPGGSIDVRHKNDTQAALDVLIHFLQTGRLPWSFGLPPGLSLEKYLLESWNQDEFKQQFPLYSKELISVLNERTARERLLSQFSPLFCKALLSRLFPEAGSIIDDVLQRLSKPFNRETAREVSVIRLIETLSSAPAAGLGTSIDDLFAPETRQASSNGAMEDANLSDIRVQRGPLDYPEAMAGVGSEMKSVKPRVPGVDDIGERHDKDRRRNSFIDDPEIAEGIYVDNAGLVLLHPFLPQLFTALGVLNEYRIVRPGRALCLLHYLATGVPRAHEYELALPKVLCNIDLPLPIEPLSLLSAEERNEADDLLGAVVKHWDALRNASIDSLRGTFLIRPGKLSRRRDGDWTLRVQYNTYDILLNSLPWGIATIKLPWMRNLLWVEWTL